MTSVFSIHIHTYTRYRNYVEDYWPGAGGLSAVVVVVVSHIQRTGCQPEKKLLYTGANPARGLLNREKKKKKKSARCSFGKKKIKKLKKSRDGSTCLGATQVGVTQVVSVRLVSVQGFLRLVS